MKTNKNDNTMSPTPQATPTTLPHVNKASNTHLALKHTTDTTTSVN